MALPPSFRVSGFSSSFRVWVWETGSRVEGQRGKTGYAMHYSGENLGAIRVRLGMSKQNWSGHLGLGGYLMRVEC